MGSDGGVVRIRQTWAQHASSLIVAALYSLYSVAFARPALRTGVVVAAVYLTFFLFSTRFGVTLTEEAAVLHGFRRRIIPWRSVQDITVERWGGSRTVVVWEANRQHRLRAPLSFFPRDPRFEEKYDAIVEWWLTHGGQRQDPSPGRLTQWPSRTPQPPPVLVSPSRTWPTVVVTGLAMLADAVVVTMAMWWPRSETTLGPMTITGGRLPETGLLLAGTVIVGLALGVGVSIRARRRVAPATEKVRRRPASSNRGVITAVAGAVASAAVMVPLAWARAAPLLMPAAFIAVSLAVGVACLTSAPWVRRLETDGRLAVPTVGPFWLPPPLGDARTLGRSAR